MEKCKQLESKELGLEDFEDAIKQILRETEENDLDKLIRNFIQGRSPLNITEAIETVHFISNEKCCNIYQWRSRTSLYWTLSTINTTKLRPFKGRSLRLVFSMCLFVCMCIGEKKRKMEIKCHSGCMLSSITSWNWKLCSQREIFVAEKQQQQEKHQALRMRVSIKQEATGQQLAAHQQRVEFMEKLLDQLKAGTA